MRIVFMGQSGPYAPYALHELCRAPAELHVVAVVEGLRRSSRIPDQWYRATPGPLPPSNESLRDLAVSEDIPCYLTGDVNNARAHEAIASVRPDWLVCVGFDRLFHASLLELAPSGGLNAHPSALPKLRGPAPLFWLLEQGATGSVLTLHGLDPREDHGPIYAQEPFVFPPGATGEAIYRVAGRLAGRMLVTTLSRARAGTLVGLAQNHAEATRAPRPTAEDCEIVPDTWQCDALVRFATGGTFFGYLWVRDGDAIRYVRRGLRSHPGRAQATPLERSGATLLVRCTDGVAALQLD